MADTKISGLTALTGANVDTAADFLAIVDTSATATKKILVDELGEALAATQAEQETGTSVNTAVSPGRQQYHPSAAKFWLKATGNSTTVDSSYNVTSIADDATGDITVTIGTDFSSANYAISPAVLNNADGVRDVVIRTIAAGTFSATCLDSSDIPTDPAKWFFSGFGDQ